MDQDEQYMQTAIDQARYCVGEDEVPRPKVGALLVKDGEVMGKAFRGETKAGDHAEFELLIGKLRNDTLAGSTLYTTLEPCTKRSEKKVPCVDRIIDRRFARVVIGMLDPNQGICGRGIRKLRGAGIATDLFPSALMAQVEEQNRDFIRYQESLSATYPTSALPVVNPHYERDLVALDKDWKLHRVLNAETFLIVTGTNVVVELLDRTAAAMLRDAIDSRGGGKPFKRAMIVSTSVLQTVPDLRSQPILSIGGPDANEVTKEIIAAAESKGKKKWVNDIAFGIFDTRDGVPRVALWGEKSAEGTRRAVEHYINSPDGLKKLLPKVWR